MSTTKRCHFVWREYLTNWESDKTLFCSVYQVKPRPLAPKKVANQRYFYEIAPFNDFEKEILIKAIDRSLPQPIINSLIKYLDSIERYFQRRELSNNLCVRDPRQLGEDLMTKDEEIFIPFLNKLVQGDLDYCLKDANRISFYTFVLMQYLRTKRMFDGLKSIEEIHIKSVITPLRRIIAYNMANYFEKNKFSTILLLNHTQQEFITSDQPAINTFVDYSNLNRHTEQFELYYPVTPKKAILITNTKNYAQKACRELSLSEVDYYNKKEINASEMQVYGSNENFWYRYMSPNKKS